MIAGRTCVVARAHSAAGAPDGDSLGCHNLIDPSARLAGGELFRLNHLHSLNLSCIFSISRRVPVD